jgi:hypothetical protein
VILIVYNIVSLPFMTKACRWLTRENDFLLKMGEELNSAHQSLHQDFSTNPLNNYDMNYIESYIYQS